MTPEEVLAESKAAISLEINSLKLALEVAKAAACDRAVQEAKDARRDAYTIVGFLAIGLTALGILFTGLSTLGIIRYLDGAVIAAVKETATAQSASAAKADATAAEQAATAAKASAAIIEDARNKLGVGQTYAVGCSNTFCMAVDNSGKVYCGGTANGSPWDYQETIKAVAPVSLGCDNDFRCALIDSQGTIWLRDPRKKGSQFFLWSKIAVGIGK
jgi:hypothetical protein